MKGGRGGLDSAAAGADMMMGLVVIVVGVVGGRCCVDGWVVRGMRVDELVGMLVVVYTLPFSRRLHSSWDE